MRRQRWLCLGGTAQVDSHGEVGLVVEGRGNRDRIHQRAVEKLPVAVVERRENQRRCDRRTDGIEELPLAQPDLLAGDEIGCNSRVHQRQALDVEVADQLAQHGHDALALEEPRATECRIEQAQHLQALQRQHPLGIDFELACSVDAPDQRAHGGTRNRANVVAVFGEPLDRTDVRQTASAAAAENERYGLRICHDVPERGGTRRCACPSPFAPDCMISLCARASPKCVRHNS